MRYWGILPLIWACTGENIIDKQENASPIVVIGSHSDGVDVLEGYAEPFRAMVSDDDNDFDELLAAWYVGENIVCDWATVSPAGESFCDIVFEQDDDNVIVEVRDPQGAGGRSEISVHVIPTESPVVEILTPISSLGYYSNQLIQFSAVVSDNEDNPEDLLVTWTSNQDGELILDTTPNSIGEISDYTYLSEGIHAIELRVEDTSGKVTKEQLVIQVGSANQAPSCSIVLPQDLSASVAGDTVIFRGMVSDPNIPATELSVLWSSDKDGSLGTGTVNTSGDVNFAYDGLSSNDHVISLLVEDEVGAQCQTSIFLFVGEPPTAEIITPLSGDVYSVGDTVVFQAMVSDTEDLSNEILVSWISSIDGGLYSASANSQGISQFSSSSLSPGVHSISFTATDTTGLMADDLILFRVNTPPTAPSVSLTPNPVYSTQTLTAVASGSTDADGQSVSYNYQWFSNGVLTALTGTSVPNSELDVGEVWTVRVTPDDGYVSGPYSEASITVSNTVPVVSNTVISSSDGSHNYNDSILTCSATGYDADGTVTISYAWNIAGAVYNGSSVNLSNYTINPGDSVSCTASVTDLNSASVSASVSDVIDNRVPSISSVSISPSPAVTASLLTCASTSTDADGESLTTSYMWMFNGNTLGTGNSLQLNNLMISPSDVVECRVTVQDESGASVSSSSSVTVQNTAPTISSLTLSPMEPTLDDTLSCVASATDVDGGTPTLNFGFFNQSTGTIYSATSSTSNSATLDLSNTNAAYDDVISCTVTATDIDTGSASLSTSVQIVNTSPVFTQTAIITPNTSIHFGTTLTCSATATDPDDGISSLSYIWLVNALQVSTGTTWIVNSNDASVNDSISCTAIAIDFQGNTTTSTSSTVTVTNSAPTMLSATLSTLTPNTVSTISTSVTATDIEGNAISYAYEWHVIDASANGADTIVLTGSVSTLSGLLFDRDDEVYCLVTPTDGVDVGLPMETNHAMVQNSPPTVPSLSLVGSITPASPAVGEDDLICSIDIPASDLDGDPLLYTFAWYDGDGVLQQETIGTTNTQDTFAASDVTLGLWSCEVTADDGTDYGGTAVVDLGVIGRESCLDYYNSGFSVSGVYNITLSDGTNYDVYCDMIRDGGGWTLVVSAIGSDTSFSSVAPLWWTAGYTSQLISPNSTGKSPAYDYSPFSFLRLSQDTSTSTVIADLSGDAYSGISLRAVVANSPYHSGDPGSNTGSTAWNNGFKTFTSVSRTGSFFQYNYIKIWHGDGSSDGPDRAVFSSGPSGNGDWSGSNNPGVIGGEFRMSASDSLYYQVWVK